MLEALLVRWLAGAVKKLDSSQSCS